MLKARPTMTKEKRSEMVGAFVTPKTKAALLAIAEAQDRTLSFVAGALMERGIQAFQRDGQLRSGSKLGVISAKAEESSRKKTKP